MDYKYVSSTVDQYTNEIIEFTRQLVRIPTENLPPEGNEYLGQEFFRYACKSIKLDIDEFSPSDIKCFNTNPAFLKDRKYTKRKNIVGKWKGYGSGRSLILSGHMDVAPKEPLEWEICQPFEGLVLGNKIYGRGSADMKGGLAAAYMSLKILKDMEWKPKGDIIIESVVDEEFASGNGTIASRFKGYNADFAINLEPTGLLICPACVGGLVYKIIVRGTSGMPYTGEEIYNPIYGIARIVNVLQKYEEYRNKNIKPPNLWDNSVQKSKVIITKISGGDIREHGQLGIPINAWVECVIQTYPGESEEVVYNDFQEYINVCADKYSEFKNLTIKIEREYHYIEPGECNTNHEGVISLTNCVEKVTQQPVKLAGAPFSCDMFAFKKYGNTPSVIFGPIGGNLHAPDEWVSIESVLKTTKALVLMVTEWCGKDK